MYSSCDMLVMDVGDTHLLASGVTSCTHTVDTL